jgi:hypothetical protein
MTILLILMFAAFTAAMLLQAGRALIGERGETPATKLLRDDLRQLEELVALRAMLLAALRELELDRELEKISTEDYQQLKRRHERQAVQIMRQLDDLYGGRGWEGAIDDALDARLGAAGAPAAPLADEDEDEVIDEQPAKKLELKLDITQPAPAAAHGWACPACARVMVDDDMFCGRCGAQRPALPAPEQAASPAYEPPAHDAINEPAAERAVTEPANP